MKTLFFKPFERYQESHLLIVGVGALLAGSFFGAIFGARFDGVLDLHFRRDVSFYTVLLDNIVNVLSLFIPLFILGKTINSHTRVVDVFNTVLIARIPYMVLPLSNLNGLITQNTSELMEVALNPELASEISSSTYIMLTVFGLISLGIMVWMITLLFNGFKISVNLKNKMHIIWFELSILLAEILSKLIINKL